MTKMLQENKLKHLYEQDENLWIFENIKLIREGRIKEIDWDNIAQELEYMGKSQFREVFSRLRVILIHLLKWKYQQEKRTTSWKPTIREQRDELNSIFGDSKTLRQLPWRNHLYF